MFSALLAVKGNPFASDSAYSTQSLSEELAGACSANLPKVKRDQCVKAWKKSHPELKVRILRLISIHSQMRTYS